MNANSVKTNMALFLILFVVFLDWIGIGLVFPVFSSMLFHPDYSILEPGTSESVRALYLGVLLACMSIAQFFSAPILGSLSDQKGRRPWLLVSVAIGVIGYVGCIVSIMKASIILLVLSRIFIGVAAGNGSIVNACIVDLSNEKNKAKYFGLSAMVCGLGFTVGPFLGGEFSKTHFAMPFVIAGIATILNFLLLLFFFKETHHTRKKTGIRWDEGVHNLKKAFYVKGLNIIFLTVFIFCFAWSFFYEFIPVTWIADFGFTAENIGFFYAYGAGVYALCSGLLIQPIVGRFKDNAVFFYALVGLGITMLSLLFLPNRFWIWIYLPIINFLGALCYPTSTTIISDKTDKDSQGEILGVLQAVQSAAFAISPLVAGVLLGSSAYMPMIVGGFGMLLAALVLGFFLRKEIFSKF